MSTKSRENHIISPNEVNDMASFRRRSSMDVLIVDPTTLNTRERLMSFLESLVYKRYTTFLPSLMSSSIQKEEWDELANLLRAWEWNLSQPQAEEWFKSSDFKNLCRRLNEVCISFEKAKEDLNDEERMLLSRALKALGRASPKIVELAKELVIVAITKKGGILSYTRHLKRWLKSLKGILILEISEKTDALSRAKEELKNRIHAAGWRGRIFVTFLNIITAVTLASILPPVINWVVDTIVTELGEEVIVGLVTNGL